MYAHHVIEDLKEHRKNDAFKSEKIDELINDIKQAKHFHFSTVENVLEILNIKPGCSLFAGDNGEYINPPYEICWFDFDFEKNNRVSKIAYLIKEVHPKWIVALYFEHNIQTNKWVPFPYSFFIGLGTDTWDFSFETLEKITKIQHLKCKISDNIIASSHYSVYSKILEDHEIYKLAKEGANLTAYLNFALMLINCKNIKLLEESPPEKINKKREKKSKQRLFSFYTLHLQLPNYLKSSPEDESNLISIDKIDKRLHFCRGHFKTYTENNPLFGKHIGRYWWPAQIKGNKSEGLVMKDYTIN